ncbi:conserved hypothetical protein [Verticillium alfalfae VaMs.102]|uniref:Uncharacterized protein n=1 Tax=Verticillium alfalfae (strain VaMs.102 / ATCC MYA-4576 / FGSC 10136) TaxID=526221 RepID=C9SA48_VERA1|nr:conserved hypothetical protein [Verticillium alfalfae VaMs.102]EEY16261.1 conserved hypothetical protein [Verticillium alfalfae VaMs.102]
MPAVGTRLPPPAEAAEGCWRSLVLGQVKRRFDKESPLAVVAAASAAAALRPVSSVPAPETLLSQACAISSRRRPTSTARCIRPRFVHRERFEGIGASPSASSALLFCPFHRLLPRRRQSFLRHQGGAAPCRGLRKKQHVFASFLARRNTTKLHSWLCWLVDVGVWRVVRGLQSRSGEGDDWEAFNESDYSGRQVPLSRSLGRCLPCGLGRWSLKTVIATVGSLVILTLLAVAGSRPVVPTPPAADDTDPHNRRLRIIVPADEPGANLCKMLLSTVANGYPAPLIINWGRDFHKQGGWFGGSHLGKIDGTLDALEALASDEEAPPRGAAAARRSRPHHKIKKPGPCFGRAGYLLALCFRRAFAKRFSAKQEVWRTMQRERQALALAGGALQRDGELFVPTVFEEDDGDYMAVNDTARINVSSEERGLSPARITGLPSDVDNLAPPLVHAGVELEEQHKDEAAHWDAVPLYTDYYTGRIPVGVHHNAHRDGMKGPRLKMWWDKNWFHPFLRDIVAAREVRPIKLAPLAVIKATSSWAPDVVYWPPATDAERRRPRIFDRKTLSQGLDEAEWHTLCRKQGERPWWDIIFDDDRGPEDLGPQKAANAVKPEVEVKEPGEETKADEKPQDKGQGERKPVDVAIIKR